MSFPRLFFCESFLALCDSRAGVSSPVVPQGWPLVVSPVWRRCAS